MNVMQLAGMLTKFMSNPDKAIRELQDNMLIPGWEAMERSEGGKIRIVVDRNGAEISILLYRAIDNANLNFVSAHSLPDILKILKQKATENGADNATAIAAPEPATATTEDTEPGTGTDAAGDIGQ